MTLREITGKRVRTCARTVSRWQRGRIENYLHSYRVFEVYLCCKHCITVPFARRPQIGRRITCPRCTEIAKREAGQS